MHKDGKCKEVMRKIKQQWRNFTDDDIARLQESYERREKSILRKYKMQRDDYFLNK